MQVAEWRRWYPRRISVLSTAATVTLRERWTLHMVPGFDFGTLMGVLVSVVLRFS